MCLWQGFQAEFIWPGTHDATAWLAVPAALAVIEALGRGTQAAHARKMLAAAVPLLQAAFGTTVMLGGSMCSAGHAVAAMQQAILRGTSPVCPHMGEAWSYFRNWGGVGINMLGMEAMPELPAPHT